MTVFCIWPCTHKKTVTYILQQDLHHLELWELTWGMEFHPGKCNSMSITRSRTSIENRYSLKWHILEDVKETKYLGVTFSPAISHGTPTFVTSLGKPTNYWDSTKKPEGQKWNSKGERIQSDSKIKSRILLYGMVTTYKKSKDKLERVQRRAARFVSDRYHNTSSVSDMISNLN